MSKYAITRDYERVPGQFWFCTKCHAENHVIDATCAWCGDCQGNCASRKPATEKGWDCDQCGKHYPPEDGGVWFRGGPK